MKYVHEDENIKEAILERIVRDPGSFSNGRDRLEYFITAMAESTSPVALKKAM